MQTVDADLSPAFLNAWTTDDPFQQYGKQYFSNSYWRVQLVCMKVEDHFSSEPPLEYNEDQMTFKNQGHLLLFLLTWELQEYYAVSSRLVRLLRLVPERKTDKETPECSRLEFLETFRSNNFASSDAEYNVDAEDNSSWLLNRGGVTDFPLLRSLLANCQNLLNSGEW